MILSALRPCTNVCLCYQYYQFISQRRAWLTRPKGGKVILSQRLVQKGLGGWVKRGQLSHRDAPGFMNTCRSSNRTQLVLYKFQFIWNLNQFVYKHFYAIEYILICKICFQRPIPKTMAAKKSGFSLKNIYVEK